jgi:orotate phosphoribosyltransferase
MTVEKLHGQTNDIQLTRHERADAMLSSEEVAEILLDIGAVSLNPTNPYKYASGILSPIYTDCRLLASFPNERKAIINLFIKIINNINHKIDIVVGTGSSAISLSTYIAQYLKLPVAYVRPYVKTHGKGKQIEGLFKKGSNALLISDILSTEQDIPISIKAINDCGGRVIYCLTIFSNSLGYIEKFLENEKIPFYSLTDLKTLLSYAWQKGNISSNEKAIVDEWMNDPENWDSMRRNRLAQMLVKSNQDIAEILLNIKAVTISSDRVYEYASGILSPIYTDNRLLISYPTKWEYVINSFVNVIINEVGTQNIDVIAGVATAGIPHAAYLAEKLGLPMVYVKSIAEEYGKLSKIEGRIERGDRVLIIEDLISTGSSVISAAKVLKEAGANVDWCLAIFTYDLKQSKIAFEQENIKLISLSDLSTLLDVALKMGIITTIERDLVLDWKKDTESL